MLGLAIHTRICVGADMIIAGTSLANNGEALSATTANAIGVSMCLLANLAGITVVGKSCDANCALPL